MDYVLEIITYLDPVTLDYLAMDNEILKVMANNVVDNKKVIISRKDHDEVRNFVMTLPEDRLNIDFIYIEHKRIYKMEKSVFRNQVRYLVAQKIRENPDYRKLIEERIQKYYVPDQQKLIRRVLHTARSDEETKFVQDEERFVTSSHAKDVAMRKFRKTNPFTSYTKINFPKETNPRVIDILKESVEKPKKRTPKVILEEYLSPTLAEKIKKMEETLSYGEDTYILPSYFKSLWDNTQYFGPLPTTLIMLGGKLHGIPARALMNMWDIMRRRILDISKTSTNSLVEIYPTFVKEYNYLYCSDSYNFIVEFFQNGLCNCECGTFLIYQISKVVPSSPKCVYTKREGHANITTLDEQGKLVTYESTEDVGRMLIPFVPENIKMGIASEQILSVSIIMTAIIQDILTKYSSCVSLGNTAAEMMGLDKSLPLRDALLHTDRTPVTNLMDSNSFDLLACQIYFISKMDLDGIVKAKDLLTINEKYTVSDIEQYFSGVSGDSIEESIDHRHQVFVDEIVNFLEK